MHAAMCRTALVFILTAICLPWQLSAAGPIRIHVQASEYANAVYHVSCLTGRIACTNRAYTSFWNEKYAVTKADGDQLDTWRNVTGEIESKGYTPIKAPLVPNYPGFFPTLVVRQEITAAALSSTSPAEFEKRIAKFATPEQAAKLRSVLEHVQTRLHPWWESTGRKLVEAQVGEMEKQIASNQVPKQLTEVGAFLGANLAFDDVYVHLIPGPNVDLQDATAAYARNHVTIEITKSTEARDAVWVVMHEMAHVMYESAPVAQHRKLIDQFTSTGDRAAQPLYALLNEALATGIQLLVFERIGKRDDDPYNHPYIPRAGRATLPLIKTFLQTRKSIFDGFAPQYLRNAKAELGAEQNKPTFLLLATSIFASDKHGDARKYLQEAVPMMASAGTEAEWEAITDLNAVRLVSFDELGTLRSPLKDAEALRGFAHVTPRGKTGQVITIAGRTPSDVTEAVKRLIGLSALPKEGVAFTLP